MAPRCLNRQLLRLYKRPPVLLMLLLTGIALVLTLHSNLAGVGTSDAHAGYEAKASVLRNSAELHPPPSTGLPTSPTSMSTTPTPRSIPKRIHHYFGDSAGVPSRLIQAVNSWANNHKDYEVYFWNTRYMEQMLLPNLPLYTRHQHCYTVERHTVSRLLILLTYGGILVDPELISLRDFASFLEGSTCILAQELAEVAALVHGLDVLPSLRFVASSSGHNFLRRLLANFCTATAVRAASRQPAASAANFAAAFNAAVSDYDDDCAKRVCDHRDRVVLADPGVFLPVVPPRLRRRLLRDCGQLHEATVGSAGAHPLRLRACRWLADPGNRNLPGVIALAVPLDPADDGEAVTSLAEIGPNARGRRPIPNFRMP